MKLEVDCTWNQKKNKGKVIITYEDAPKSLFFLKPKIIERIKFLEKNCLLEGPKALTELETIAKENEKSLYAIVAYFKALNSFEFFDDAKDLFANIKKRFPSEVFTKCIEARYLLQEKNFDHFPKIFSHYEVLKAAFPKRKLFHFSEALLFHNLWQGFCSLQADVDQAKKHEQFVGVILKAYQAFGLTQATSSNSSQ